MPVLSSALRLLPVMALYAAQDRGNQEPDPHREPPLGPGGWSLLPESPEAEGQRGGERGREPAGL